MKANLFVWILVFCPAVFFAQKQYVYFQPGDTATYHIWPSVSASDGSTIGWFAGRVDSTRKDTVYNALKHFVLVQRNSRDTAADIIISHDTIIQDGKRLAII